MSRVAPLCTPMGFKPVLSVSFSAVYVATAGCVTGKTSCTACKSLCHLSPKVVFRNRLYVQKEENGWEHINHFNWKTAIARKR